MHKRNLIINFILIIATLGCSVNALAKGPGTVSGLTLLEPLGARPVSLGEAYTSISNDIHSFSYNPSGIADLRDKEISVMYNRGIDEDNYTSIVYAHPTTVGVIGVSILYYTSGDIELIDNKGNVSNINGQRDYIVRVGWARDFNVYQIGAVVKYLQSQLVDQFSAHSTTIDLGIIYSTGIKNLQIGASLQNVGTQLQYRNTTEDVPFLLRTGVSYRKDINHSKLLFTVDVIKNIHEQKYLLLTGIECNFRDIIALRAGYKTNVTYSENEDTPLSFGVGFHVKKTYFDYTYSLAKNLIDPHIINVGYKF